MITLDPLSIKNWEKYQNTGRLAEIREYNREKQRESRARKKQRDDVNDMSMTSQRGQDPDIEPDIEIETERDSEEDIETRLQTDSKPYLLALSLGERIHSRLPTTEPPDEQRLQRWADAIDKCNRIDGHPWEEIQRVLEFSQDDAFWQTVILSGEKLREKYLQLLAKMTTAHKGGSSKPIQEASVDRVARLLKEGAFAE